MRWCRWREPTESDDYDGDGVCNSSDLDDDNDGILDTQESNLVTFLSVVAGSGVTIDNNNMTVTSSLPNTGWGAASIHSNDLGIGPEVDFTLSMQVDLITSRYIMIGLNAVGDNSTNSYTDIDYGFYFNNNNSNVRIYENGSSKGFRHRYLNR